MPKNRLSVILFFASTIFLWSSLYTYIAFLPVYAEEVPGGTISTVGFVLGAYSIALSLLRIPLGVWSDRLGRRKPFIMAGLLASSIGALGLALAPNVWFLASARAITGIGAAVWVVFTVLYSSYFPPEKAPQAMGVMAFLMGLSQVIASYSGGFLADHYGVESTFYIAAVLAFLGFCCMTGVPETPAASKYKFSLTFVKRLVTKPLLIQVSIPAAIIMSIVFSVSLGFLPVYADDFNASKSVLGLLSMAMFASYTLSSLATTVLAPRFGLRLVVAVGAITAAAGSLIVPWINEVNYLFPSEVLIGIGWGFTVPLLMGLSIRDVEPSEKATAMGIFQSIYGIGMLLGPFITGIFASLWGLDLVFYVCAGLGLICLALVTAKVPLR